MQMLLDSMTVQLAGTQSDSIVDGDGVRLVLFFQGCSHKCDGCQNDHTWNPKGGYEAKLNDIFEVMRDLNLKHYQGITLSGGEPLEQPEQSYLIAKKAHELGLDVWLYTGYVYEDIRWKYDEVLREVDMLVDGPYIKALRTVNGFYGSSNQRILNLKEGRRNGYIVVNEEAIYVPRKEEDNENNIGRWNDVYRVAAI